MMFLFAVPVMEAMAVYLVPLMVGTRNIAFPRLNAFSYWIYLAGGVLLWIAFAIDMGPDVGWFAYVPLSGPQYAAGKRADIWAQMITFTEVAALAVAVETRRDHLQAARAGHVARPHPAVRLGDAGHLVPGHHGDAGDHDREHQPDPRPAGRHAFLQSGRGRRRAALAASVLVLRPSRGLHHLPAGGRHGLDHGRDLRAPAGVRLPGAGDGADRHRHPRRSGSGSTTCSSTGLPRLGESFFTASSMAIAIPAGIQIFCWLATLWDGRPVFRTPLLFVIGFIVTFVIGGLTGVMVASVPFDTQVHDTYFVVAHFHYVLIGGAVFPLLGAVYYWFPKITGRMMSETLGPLVVLADLRRL